MLIKELEVSINDKIVKIGGDYEGNLFCIKEKNIDKHPALSSKEKENLKMNLRSNKNILQK